jgi:hypothetical protein
VLSGLLPLGERSSLAAHNDLTGSPATVIRVDATEMVMERVGGGGRGGGGLISLGVEVGA